MFVPKFIVYLLPKFDHLYFTITTTDELTSNIYSILYLH